MVVQLNYVNCGSSERMDENLHLSGNVYVMTDLPLL